MIPKIGAHVSAAGGLYKACENALKIGAAAIQIFGSSPQQWAVRTPKKEELEQFKKTWKAAGSIPVFLHAPYLINLASENEIIRTRSIYALAGHLEITEKIGATGLIFHIGSNRNQPKQVARDLIIKGCQEVLKRTPGESFLILENSSAGGGKIGSEAREVGEILKELNLPRAKVCFDTAHAFEAGIIKYNPHAIKKTFDEWDKEVGIQNIVVIHANDSKTEYGSHNDRHENIGEGYIGLEGFKNLAKEKRLHDKPWILEVPGFNKIGPDKKNIDILKACFR